MFLPEVPKGSLFSTSLPTVVIYVFFIITIWQVWSDISLWFWFAFPRWLVMSSIFSRACCPCVCPLWQRVYSSPLSTFLKNYLNWRLITLQYCGGFCHTFTRISHGCTCVPHPDPPSHLSPHPIPQGHPSALALSTLSHALNVDWRSISHMIIYMFVRLFF